MQNIATDPTWFIGPSSCWEAEFRWHLVAVTPDVAFVQGETIYRTPRHTYSNLWVIRLDTEGRCTEFTEWWMRHPLPDEPTLEPSNQP